MLFPILHNRIRSGGYQRETLNKKKIRLSLAVALTALLFTMYYLILDYFETPAWIPLLVFVFLLCLFSAARRHPAGHFIPAQKRRGNNPRAEKIRALYHRAKEFFYLRLTDREYFLLCWLLLSLFYLPAWLAMFPGTFGYDAPIQVAEFFGDADTHLTSHHPLAHTFLMGALLSLGNGILHSYTAGFALYIALQGLAVTGSMAYSLSACRRHGVSLIWTALGGMWAALNPFLWVLTFTSTKDILFGAFLLCFTVALWELLECGAPGRGQYIRLAVFGILMCLFRNQGIYMIVALLLFCLLLRTGKKWLCPCLLLICLITQCFFSVSATVLDIPEGDKKEMLCVPMQQMARVCSLWKTEDGSHITLTREQYETTNRLLTPEGIQSYVPDSADNVKSAFRTDVLTEDFGRYFSNYVAMGLQNPREYLLAWVELIRPYWDMTRNEYKGLAFYYSFPERNRWGIQRQQPNRLFELFFSLLYRIVQSPRCNLFWRPEACLWILAALPGLALARKRKTLFLSVLPLGLYFGTALLGPVALLRYLFPLTMATPLLLGMLFQPHRRNR